MMNKTFTLALLFALVSASAFAQQPPRATVPTFQAITIDATAGGIAVPRAVYQGMAGCILRNEQGEIRYRVDGTAPTAAVGTVLGVGEVLILQDVLDLASFRGIRTGATSGVLSVSCWLPGSTRPEIVGGGSAGGAAGGDVTSGGVAIASETSLQDLITAIPPAGQDLDPAADVGTVMKCKVAGNLDGMTVGVDLDQMSVACDQFGRVITVPGCSSGDSDSVVVTLANATSTQAFAAVANVIYEVYAIEIINNSTLDTYVEIEDGNNGTVRWVLAAPATTDTIGGNNLVFTEPLRKFTANTPLHVQASDAPTGGDAQILVALNVCRVRG
jgi:hypothetical protein